MSDRLCIERREVQKKQNATFEQLSMMQVVACDKGPLEPGGNKGCEGGQPWAAMSYAHEKGGLVPEACYPYLKPDGPIGTCSDEPCLKFQTTPKCPASLFHKDPICADASRRHWKDVAVELTQSDYIVQLSTPMALEIMHYGPITASMVVYNDFLNYTSGVYRVNSDTAVGAHAVKIIGWGSDPEPYWLVQNSWTTRWGEGGYFRIRRGDNSCEANICNLCNAVMWYGNHSDLTTGRPATIVDVMSGPLA